MGFTSYSKSKAEMVGFSSTNLMGAVLDFFKDTYKVQQDEFTTHPNRHFPLWQLTNKPLSKILWLLLAVDAQLTFVRIIFVLQCDQDVWLSDQQNHMKDPILRQSMKIIMNFLRCFSFKVIKNHCFLLEIILPDCLSEIDRTPSSLPGKHNKKNQKSF